MFILVILVIRNKSVFFSKPFSTHSIPSHVNPFTPSHKHSLSRHTPRPSGPSHISTGLHTLTYIVLYTPYPYTPHTPHSPIHPIALYTEPPTQRSSVPLWSSRSRCSGQSLVSRGSSGSVFAVPSRGPRAAGLARNSRIPVSTRGTSRT